MSDYINVDARIWLIRLRGIYMASTQAWKGMNEQIKRKSA